MIFIVNASPQVLTGSDEPKRVQEYADNLVIRIEEWCIIKGVTADVVIDKNPDNWVFGSHLKHQELSNYMIEENRVAVYYYVSKETITDAISNMIKCAEGDWNCADEAWAKIQAEAEGGAA